MSYMLTVESAVGEVEHSAQLPFVDGNDMKAKKKSGILLAVLVCCSCIVSAWTVTTGQTVGAGSEAKTSGEEVRMLQPSEVFRDFPEIRWEMSFEEVKKAIEKSGGRPVGFKDSKTELAWEGTFNGITGRGTVLFRDDGSMFEIAVITYAMEKRKSVYESFLKKLEERHGATKEKEDDSIATSKVWRLKNGFAIEVRLLKDENSPVVDIHWVKL
jgi:hypothetical protein